MQLINQWVKRKSKNTTIYNEIAMDEVKVVYGQGGQQTNESYGSVGRWLYA